MVSLIRTAACVKQYQVVPSSNSTRLTAIFRYNVGKPVPECLHSGFYWS